MRHRNCNMGACGNPCGIECDAFSLQYPQDYTIIDGVKVVVAGTPDTIFAEDIQYPLFKCQT